MEAFREEAAFEHGIIMLLRNHSAGEELMGLVFCIVSSGSLTWGGYRFLSPSP